jgi:hypothetical protein
MSVPVVKGDGMGRSFGKDQEKNRDPISPLLVKGCKIFKHMLGAEGPVRIQVRIDPPHPLVCRKRRLNGAVLWMRPEKPRSRVTAGVAR